MACSDIKCSCRIDGFRGRRGVDERRTVSTPRLDAAGVKFRCVKEYTTGSPRGEKPRTMPLPVLFYVASAHCSQPASDPRPPRRNISAGPLSLVLFQHRSAISETPSSLCSEHITPRCAGSWQPTAADPTPRRTATYRLFVLCSQHLNLVNLLCPPPDQCTLQSGNSRRDVAACCF